MQWLSRSITKLLYRNKKIRYIEKLYIGHCGLLHDIHILIIGEFNFMKKINEKKVIENLKVASMWFQKFIDEICIVGVNEKVSSSLLYSTYQNYCDENNFQVKCTKEFYGTLKECGFINVRHHNYRIIKGLNLRDGRKNYREKIN